MLPIFKTSCLARFFVIVIVIASFYIGIDYGERRARKIETTQPETTDFLSENYILQLQRETGWRDPEAKIKENLLSQPDIIPYDPVLGGTMGFFSAENIYLLTNNLAIAYFEDGHISGYIILSYEISAQNEIFWQTIHSYLE